MHSRRAPVYKREFVWAQANGVCATCLPHKLSQPEELSPVGKNMARGENIYMHMLPTTQLFYFFIRRSGAEVS
jgi:hypothetical protein